LFIACPGNIIRALVEAAVMRSRLIILLLLILVTVGLTGCGQKGPLTLPEDDDEKSKSTS
jgi:predicted small lipoprotein YifL